MRIDLKERFQISGLGDFQVKQSVKKYQAWSNGCCIGEFNSQNDARVEIHEHAKAKLKADIEAAEAHLSLIKKSYDALNSDDVWVLAQFLVKEPQ